MRFTKMKNEPLIGKVWNDDKTLCYGIYGQVGALLDKEFLHEINTGREMWVFIEKSDNEYGECEPQPSRESLKAFLQLHLIEPNAE